MTESPQPHSNEPERDLSPNDTPMSEAIRNAVDPDGPGPASTRDYKYRGAGAHEYVGDDAGSPVDLPPPPTEDDLTP